MLLWVWEVVYTDQFGAWFGTLAEDQQDAAIARVELLETEGPALGRPTVDTIEGSRHQNMKELRVSKGGAIRVLFAFDPRRQAVLWWEATRRASGTPGTRQRSRWPMTSSATTSTRPARPEGRRHG